MTIQRSGLAIGIASTLLSATPLGGTADLGHFTALVSKGDDARVLILRSAFDLEQPFLPLGEESLTAEVAVSSEKPGKQELRPLLSHHGGWLLPAGLLIDPGRTITLTPSDRFSMHPVKGSSRIEGCSCGGTWKAIGREPFAGNLFAGRFDGTFVELEVIARDGEPLAGIRLDAFSADPPADLGGRPADPMDRAGARGGWFWFADERLAPFVRTYRRVAGADYARYIVSAFLLHARVDKRTRLPFLPTDADARRLLDRPAVSDNLRRISTAPWQERGRLCTVFPLLKILEDRDCRGKEGACPVYSAMAPLAALLEQQTDETSERARVAFDFSKVIEAIAAQGVCEERFYPYLPEAARGKRLSPDQFRARAETELRRIVTQRDPRYAEFLATVPTSGLSFEGGVPPACFDDLRRSREARPISREDFVSLLATASLTDLAPLAREERRDVIVAQQQELALLLQLLLGNGALVAIAGLDGVIANHAVLAYGVEQAGLLVMDSAVRDATDRRRHVIPWPSAGTSIDHIAFLRDAAPAFTPSGAQARRALEVDPDDAWTLGDLAASSEDEDRISDAIRLYRRAVELSPKWGRAWESLGFLLSETGRHEEAESALLRAIETGTDRSFTRRQLGLVYRAEGRWSDAERELRRAVEQQPDNPWAWIDLAWTLDALGRKADALACMEKAVSAAPDNRAGAGELALLLTAAGRRHDARVRLLQFLAAHPRAAGRARLAAYLSLVGPPDEPMAILRDVLRETPDDASAVLELARILVRAGRRDEAAAALAPLERTSAQDADATPKTRVRMAYALALTGRADAARSAVAALLADADIVRGRDLYDLACVVALTGDATGALSLLQRAFAHGYKNVAWARLDPDLAPLAERREFGELCGRYAAPAGAGDRPPPAR